jgi:hypothetical protein
MLRTLFSSIRRSYDKPTTRLIKTIISNIFSPAGQDIGICFSSRTNIRLAWYEWSILFFLVLWKTITIEIFFIYTTFDITISTDSPRDSEALIPLLSEEQYVPILVLVYEKIERTLLITLGLLASQGHDTFTRVVFITTKSRKKVIVNIYWALPNLCSS